MTMRSIKAVEFPLSFTGSMIIGVLFFLMVLNLGARTLDFQVSDHDELRDFEDHLERISVGRTSAFSFHTIPDGLELVAIMHRPDTINMSLSALDDADLTDEADINTIRRQGQEIVISSDMQELRDYDYVAEPSGCDPEKSCICIFRGSSRDSERRVIEPVRLSCHTIGLNFQGDSLTVLSNHKESGIDWDGYEALLEHFEEDPPVLRDDGTPWDSGLKILSNVREDSNLLTIRVRKTEDSFFVCMDRNHCDIQYRLHSGTSRDWDRPY